MKKFTESHEWIEVVKGIAKVGITDYAQKELGEIVYVELPKVGQRIRAGEEAAVLETTKAAVDVYSPLEGEIIEVNSDLNHDPGKVNTFAEREGWLFKVKNFKRSDIDQLMNEKEYYQLKNKI